MTYLREQSSLFCTIAKSVSKTKHLIEDIVTHKDEEDSSKSAIQHYSMYTTTSLTCVLLYQLTTKAPFTLQVIPIQYKFLSDNVH